MAPARLGASVFALAGMVVGAGCASSGTSAGVYHPAEVTHVIAGAHASYPGEPSGVHVAVSLSDRKLYLKDGETVVRAYEIGIGQPEYPTPEGTYHVDKIVWNPPWTPPDAGWAAGKEPEPPGASANPMKVVKIYFKEPDYYIHGTGSISTLGGAVSHGCLRMAPEDAASLAKYLMDHGGASKDEDWFEHVQSSNETVTVTLPDPVELHVGH